MKFKTRHINGLQGVEQDVPTVFIENMSERTAANKPKVPLPGLYWTPTTALKVGARPEWSCTQGEIRVRVPLLRYQVPSHPPLVAGAMLEMGLLARDHLAQYLGQAASPEFCHVFISDLFSQGEGRPGFWIYFGLSFQFSEE